MKNADLSEKDQTNMIMKKMYICYIDVKYYTRDYDLSTKVS